MGDAVKLTPVSQENKALLRKLEEDAGTSINLCYQCGKCTAGCPVAFAMDYTPRQVIRLLQLGMVEKALESESIWICATCDTCSARCPRGVDIASLMDTLRREAFRQDRINDKKVALFNKAFLGCVKMFGKSYEAGILMYHNILTRQFFKDAELGIPMMKRGKISPFPDMILGKDEVKRIFQRVEEMGGE